MCTFTMHQAIPSSCSLASSRALFVLAATKCFTMAGVEAVSYKSLPKHELANPVSEAEAFESVTRAIEIVDELLCNTLPGAMAQVEQAFSVVQMVKSVLQEVSRKHGGDDTDCQAERTRHAMLALGYTEPNSPTPSIEEWLATWQKCSARVLARGEDIDVIGSREGDENSPPRTPQSEVSGLATPASGSTKKASTSSSPYAAYNRVRADDLEFAETVKSHPRARTVEEKFEEISLAEKRHAQGVIRTRPTKTLRPDTDTSKVSLLRTPSPVFGRTRPVSDFKQRTSASPGSSKNSGGKAPRSEKKPSTPTLGKVMAASPVKEEPAPMAPIYPGKSKAEKQHIEDENETELEVAGWLCDQHGRAHARLKQHIQSAYAGEHKTFEEQLDLDRQAAFDYCVNIISTGGEKIKEVSPETLKKLQRPNPPIINTRPRCSGCGSKEHIPLQCPATAMGVTVGDLLANAA